MNIKQEIMRLFPLATQTEFEWTAPYFGHEHMQGLPRGYRLTVIDYGNYVIFQGSNPLHQLQDKTFSTVAAAKTYAEGIAILIHMEFAT